MNRVFSTIGMISRTFNLEQRGFVQSILGLRSPLADTLQIRGAKFGREYQPNNLQRKRKHGYLKRKRTEAGRKVLEARKAKGRKWLSH